MAQRLGKMRGARCAGVAIVVVSTLVP